MRKQSEVSSSCSIVTIDGAVLPVGIHPREMKTSPHKNVHINVHGGIIPNTEKVETTEIPIDGRMINKCGASIQWGTIQP